MLRELVLGPLNPRVVQRADSRRAAHLRGHIFPSICLLSRDVILFHVLIMPALTGEEKLAIILNI